jgi:hypothetical protein
LLQERLLRLWPTEQQQQQQQQHEQQQPLQQRPPQQRRAWVEVDAAAQARLSRELQQRLQHTVWLSGGCDSWYLTSFGSGSGSGGSSGGGSSSGGSSPRRASSSVMWPGLCVEFWWRTRRPRACDWVAGVAAAGGGGSSLGSLNSPAAVRCTKKVV